MTTGRAKRRNEEREELAKRVEEEDKAQRRAPHLSRTAVYYRRGLKTGGEDEGDGTRGRERRGGKSKEERRHEKGEREESRRDEVGRRVPRLFLTRFSTLYDGVHHRTTGAPATWWWRVGGSQREACTVRATLPTGLEPSQPPLAPSRHDDDGGGGWDAATTPTLRNHLYLVDVTTYHPLSGGGGGGDGDGGGDGGDGGGGGSGGGGCGEVIVEVARRRSKEGEEREAKAADEEGKK